MSQRKYWLIKSEPNSFSFDDLKSSSYLTTHWEGVRNYQARNYMKDEMKKGDLALFYHSNCKEPGVQGIVEITREAYPDHTSWDPTSQYFDPKSSPDNPRWFMVNVTLKNSFKHIVTLKELKAIPELKDMKVVQKGQRLSVQPVTQFEFEKICKMGMIEIK